jgi:hypothetical protein
MQMVVSGWHMGGLVDPVLEEFPIGGRSRDQVARMRTKPSKERQFLTAHQHVDRVDLDEAHVVECAPEVATVDSTGRPGTREALGAECETTRLGDVEMDGGAAHGRDQSATVMVTDSMTTGVVGLSPGPVGTFCMRSMSSTPFTVCPKRL